MNVRKSCGFWITFRIGTAFCTDLTYTGSSSVLWGCYCEDTRSLKIVNRSPFLDLGGNTIVDCISGLII